MHLLIPDRRGGWKRGSVREPISPPSAPTPARSSVRWPCGGPCCIPSGGGWPPRCGRCKRADRPRRRVGARPRFGRSQDPRCGHAQALSAATTCRVAGDRANRKTGRYEGLSPARPWGARRAGRTNCQKPARLRRGSVYARVGWRSSLLQQPVRPRSAGRRAGCACLLYTSPSPRDRTRSRMPSSA